MTDILTIYPNATSAESSPDEIRIASDSGSSSFVLKRIPRRVPLFIPREQAYYWSREWQESIRESHKELEAGEYVDFDDPNDPDAVVRWLLSDEGDE